MSILEVAEGTRHQSADESLAYSITTTNWVANPTGPSAVVVDETAAEDVTDTVFPSNSPSASNDVITLSLLKNLIKGHRYRVEVKFTVGTNIYEFYFHVLCDF